MKKTFKFGKIDYYHPGIKNNPVEVEIELRTTKNNEVEFTACGDIWNHTHTRTYSSGQNLDEIAKYVTNSTFLEIYDLWKKWHLNTMHAGTERQEEALDAWHESQQAENKITLFDYKKDCEYLESIGLNPDIYNSKPYYYGHAWLTRTIPDADLARINKLLEVNN